MKPLLRKTIQNIYKKSIAQSTASFVFWGFLLAYIQNRETIQDIVFLKISFVQKGRLIFDTIYNFYFVNLHAGSLFLHTVLIALLSAQTVAIIYYVVNKKSVLGGKRFTLGVLLALVGSGCASCSAAVLSFVFGATLATSILGFLPYHGAEFLLLAIGITAWSTCSIIKKISEPSVCE